MTILKNVWMNLGKYLNDFEPVSCQKYSFMKLLKFFHKSAIHNSCLQPLLKIAEKYETDSISWTLKGFWPNLCQSGPEVIKLFSCSTQLSMKFFLLINVKMPTIVGILTFMSWKNSILGLPEPKKGRISWYFYTCEHLEFHAQLSMKKVL